MTTKKRYNLYLIVVNNAHHDGIMAYACVLMKESPSSDDDVMHQIIGSVEHTNQIMVMVEILQDMAWWIWQNLKPPADITIYMQAPELMTDVNAHNPLLNTYNICKTIKAKLQGYRWQVRNIRESIDILMFATLVRKEAYKHRDEALVDDESRLHIQKNLHRVIDVKWNGRMCGTVIGGVYRSVRSDQHYCRKYQGWGIQKAIVDRLEKMHVHTFKIIYQQKGHSNVIYSLSTQEFKAHAITDCLNPADGIQMFVPAWRWMRE